MFPAGKGHGRYPIHRAQLPGTGQVKHVLLAEEQPADVAAADHGPVLRGIRPTPE